jgi:hypothetical protein
MKLYNFYHIYADGQWETPVTEYIEALKTSNLLNNLEQFNIGIVGSDENRAKVKEFLKNIKHNIVAEELIGWEQVTQNKMYEFSKDNEGYVLYAHTKGSWNPHPPNPQWRRSMVKYTVENWKNSISKLLTYDAAGSELFKPPNETFMYYAGTFFWTKLSHIKKLGLPKLNTRYDAEGWLNSNNSSMFNFNNSIVGVPKKVFFNRKDFKPTRTSIKF